MEKLNWNNLGNDKCPKCGKNLHILVRVKKGKSSDYRVGFRTIKTGGEYKDRLIKCRAANNECDFFITMEKYGLLKGKTDAHIQSIENRLMKESDSLLDFYIRRNKELDKK